MSYVTSCVSSSEGLPNLFANPLDALYFIPSPLSLPPSLPHSDLPPQLSPDLTTSCTDVINNTSPQFLSVLAVAQQPITPFNSLVLPAGYQQRGAKWGNTRMREERAVVAAAAASYLSGGGGRRGEGGATAAERDGSSASLNASRVDVLVFAQSTFVFFLSPHRRM